MSVEYGINEVGGDCYITCVRLRESDKTIKEKRVPIHMLIELFWHIWTSTKYLFAYFFLARCYVVAKVYNFCVLRTVGGFGLVKEVGGVGVCSTHVPK